MEKITSFKAKDLARLTGKSVRQCERDVKKIKQKKNTSGRQIIITDNDVCNFYGINNEFIDSKLYKNK